MPSPSQAQSHVRYPLTAILGSAGNVRVLRTLVADRAPQSAPQLATKAGLSPQGVRLVLDALAQQQLVKVHGSGRTQLYALNEAHPFASALATLFGEEQLRWEQLLDTVREMLGKQGSAVRGAWLYGSVARGEDTARSDLDIALLVSSHEVGDAIREQLMPLEDEQQLRISITALTPKDLAALPEDDRWWAGVVRDARVLKGPAPSSAKRQADKAVA
ncbi:MAG TPA: nucleotidyltransferase domain-containing protein [Burkholderiaceae bacterium]|jgi:predicted nucleotidyltransferase